MASNCSDIDVGLNLLPCYNVQRHVVVVVDLMPVLGVLVSALSLPTCPVTWPSAALAQAMTTARFRGAVHGLES